jgi:hypothetical protein
VLLLRHLLLVRQSRDLHSSIFDGDRDVWRNERMFSTRVSLEVELPGALAGVHT